MNTQMQKNKIDLSIIIISLSTDKYHTKDQLDVTLKSIAPAIKNLNTEVIVVDNSTIDDGTLEMSQKYIKNLTYLKRNRVYSFCENNNYGVKNARGRYVLFLNNDVKILDTKIFEEMIDFLDKNQDVGVVGPALLNSDSKTLQASGGAFPNLANVVCWMIFFNSRYHPNLNYYKIKHNQDWITGAYYLARKEVLDKVGVFDEEFGAYVEEVDLSYRIKKSGFDIMYLPNWKIIHFGGLSYGNENSLLFELKNIKLFYKKHYPSWQLPILSLVIKLGCVLRIVMFSILKPKLVKTYAKAFRTV